jgi:hypothetical protein
MPSATDLKTKNKTELIALCKDKNIKGYSGKDELIEILCQGEIKNEELVSLELMKKNNFILIQRLQRNV